MRNGKPSGFTLVELLVVLSILALLLTLAVPRYFKGIERAKEATLKHDLNAMRESIDKFYADTGAYPESLEDSGKTRIYSPIASRPHYRKR